MTTALAFDRFPTYAELTGVLERWRDEHTGSMSLESLGRSHEGRDIWLVTVTDPATGDPADKPALWIEANIHSVELTGSLAALHLVHRLLSGGPDDERIERVRRTRTVYVVPRLNPDGAEAALGHPPRFVRSSVRQWPAPWPRPEPELRGVLEGDIDGDGRILDMRVADPHGPWKADPDEPRLLVAREPDEEGEGPYYRLLPEGEVHDYDGLVIPGAREPAGLDLNRNWPMEWAPESDQHGAGPYPTSEPEVAAAVAAMAGRPNICLYVAYHTYGGVHLRPWSAHPDEKFPTFDLRVYQDLGKRLSRITGYRNASVFHDFKYDLHKTEAGASDDWAYDHLGVLAWTWELWSIVSEAGIGDDHHLIEWYNDHPDSDDRALLAWADEHAPGAFVDWYPFHHPQLGPVELGGWHALEAWVNPPSTRREAEAAKVTEAAVFCALITPRLEVGPTRVERVSGEDGGEGPQTWRIRVVVVNSGWLPTNVTERAVQRKAVRPVTAILAPGEGVHRAGGRDEVELGQLAGRALKRNTTRWDRDVTTDRAVAEWIVTGPRGAEVQVELRHQRAGTCTVRLHLEESGEFEPREEET